MDPVQSAQLLKRAGRFGDALRSLPDRSGGTVGRFTVDVLRAELLERIGELSQGQTIATALLKSGRLSPSDESVCERTLGSILFMDGDVDQGVARLHRAVARARAAGDLENLFGALSRLLVIVTDRCGLSAGAVLLDEARDVATRLGDAQITATLHLFVGEMEAKRGLFDNAEKHRTIARHIMAASPNTYLEAFSENLGLAIAVLQGRFDDARVHGDRAMVLAPQSGAAMICQAAIGNVGNLLYSVGEFQSAIELLEQSLALLPSSGSKSNAALDSIARIHLAEGRLDA